MTIDFYHIQQQEISGNECSASFFLHPEHAIFKGHFPGNPVLPGVCMIQMIKDVFSDTIGIKTHIRTIHQVKFLELIVPEAETVLQLYLHWTTTEPGQWQVQADLKKGEKVFCKFKGIFVEAQP